MNNLLNQPDARRLAKHQIVHMLDAICQAIEPTETHYKDAKDRYETIGQFLAEESSPLHCYDPIVYPQGSMRIKTAIRPFHGREFDVDLVCEFRQMPQMDPKQLKKLVWDRFHTSDRYRKMAVEKNRCVQIQYAGDFHMDVMPCVPGQTWWVKVGSVWVPDKKLDDWKPSNPKGFAQFVEVAAAKQPVQKRLIPLTVEAKAAAEVQPLDTEQTFTKPALIRTIQILKRHRDEFFREDLDKAPISVIITTLATHSYSRVVDTKEFESAYDLLLEVVEGMLQYIKITADGKYLIANPSHPAENFAEKWNDDIALSDAFFRWHRAAHAQLKAFAEKESSGLDKIGKVLEGSFGAVAAKEALRALSSSVRDNTALGKTAITAAGLVVPAVSGYKVSAISPKHTNFGS